jgi:WD40 repeat protein
LTANPLRSDPVFEALVEEFTRLVENGQAPAVDSFAARYPNYGAELRRLLPAVKALAGLAVPAPDAGRSDDDLRSPPQVRELGDFRLVQEIGRGGMGIVYEAEQLSLGRRVAVKVLPFAAVLDPRQLQRFKNEARAAATLDHPHIVGVYSVGMERSVHFYAMQFIEGQSLAELIADLKANSGNTGVQSASRVTDADSTRPRSRQSTARPGSGREHFRQAANWGIQAGQALEHAHQLGIVHRDIKPSNILVNAEGHLWVADFGLALTSADSDLTMTGDVLGTLRYMSPEQARGEKRILDQRTDVYSLGVTLYELLAFKPAFPDTDRRRLLHQILTDDPTPLRYIRPDVPADLETIVHKAASKEPADRYPSAQALVDDLQRFLAGRPVRARRAGAGERALKWIRRHPSWAAVAALVFLIAVGVPIALALHAHRLQVANGELATKSGESDKNAERARQNERRSRQNQYAANSQLAASLQADGNPMPGERLLRRWIPNADDADDVRGVEWGVLWNHRVREVGRWQTAMRWFPKFACWCVPTGAGDHLLFAYSSWNGLGISTLRPDGVQEDRILRPSDGCKSAPIWIQSAVGDLLVAGAQNRIEVWDHVNGILLRTMPTDSPVEALAVSPSQTRLVWYGGNAVHVCRWPEGHELVSLAIPARNPQLIVIPGDEAVLIFNYEGRPIDLLDLKNGSRQTLVDRSVKAVAISPGGGTMALATGDQIHVYNLPAGTFRLAIPGHAGGIRIPEGEGGARGTRSLAFRDDFCLASCGDDGTVRWWDASVGRLLGSLRWQTQPLDQVEWSGDGHRLTAYVGATGIFQQWELPRDTALHESCRTAGLMALSLDGRQVAFVDDRNQVWLVDGDLTEPPNALPHAPWPIVDLRFSDDGARLAVADERGVGMFSMPSRERLWSSTFRSPCLARFNPEGNRLVVAGGDGLVTIVAADDGTIVGQYGETGPAVRDAVLLPGGLWLAVVASQGEMASAVRMFPTDGGIPTVIRPPDHATIHSLALVPRTHRFLTFAGSGDVHEFDCEQVWESGAIHNLEAWKRRAGMAVSPRTHCCNGTCVAWSVPCFADRVGGPETNWGLERLQPPALAPPPESAYVEVAATYHDSWVAPYFFVRQFW